MGYRRLLKSYLQHVDQLIGSTLIETVIESALFCKRDLGELSGIAAEVARENANRDRPPEVDYGALLVEVIRGNALTVEEVADLSQMKTATLNQWCYGETEGGIAPLTDKEFSQILFAVLGSKVRQRALMAGPQP